MMNCNKGLDTLEKHFYISIPCILSCCNIWTAEESDWMWCSVPAHCAWQQHPHTHLCWNKKQLPLSLQMHPYPKQTSVSQLMSPDRTCCESQSPQKEGGERARESSVSQSIPLSNQGRKKKQSLATGGACPSKSPFDWRLMQTPDWKWFIYFSRGCEIINHHWVSGERHLRPLNTTQTKGPTHPKASRLWRQRGGGAGGKGPGLWIFCNQHTHLLTLL